MVSFPQTGTMSASDTEAKKIQAIERCQALSELLVWPGRARLDSVGWLSNFQTPELPCALTLLKSVMFFNHSTLERLFLATFGKLRRFATPFSTDVYLRQDAWKRFRQSMIITMMTGESPSMADSGFIFLRYARDLAHVPETRIVAPEKAVELAGNDPNLHVVLVDDFIGSGDQLVTTWNRPYHNGNSFASLSESVRARFYCCPLFCTWRAAERISKDCRNLNLVPGHLLEERYSVLSSDYFVEHSLSDLPKAVSDISLRAGINRASVFGYHNLALSLMMEHGTPDATLPIFTFAKGGWKPLIIST